MGVGDDDKPKSLLRKLTIAVAWIIGFVAPVKGAYEYVASDHLARFGLSTKLTIWQVLLNLARGAGYLFSTWFVLFFVIYLLCGVPVIFIKIRRKMEDGPARKQREQHVVSVCAVVASIAMTPPLIGVLWISLSDAPKIHGFTDWWLTVLGAFVLLLCYFNIYASATGLGDGED